MTKPSILIIDDEKNIRTILRQCLELAGYQVTVAINGYEGLEKLTNEEVQLVLLDMMMPGMNGLETLRRIRDLKPKLPVVMITAHGTIENAVETLKLGAVDYLRKPFTPDEIRNVCADVLSRQELDEEGKLTAIDLIRLAKAAVTEEDFHRAQDMLHRAISDDPSRPEPFNLLGVILEMENKVREAQKMYRAALALDPSYRPADANLHRTAQFEYTMAGIQLDDQEAEKRGSE